MADEIGRGVVRVEGDTSSFDAAMAKSAKTAEQAQQKIAGAAGKIGESMAGAAKESERAVEQLNAAQKRHLSRLERTAVEMERGRAGYLEFKAAQLGITNEAAPFITRMRQSEAAVGKLGLSAKQTTAAMRLLPAQITDIVTGLASGQPAYLVAIQQGGQLKDSFGGVVPAAKALAGVFTPLRIAIGGVAGAAIGLAIAYNQGSKEAEAYNRALITTGNLAGITTGQLQAMAAAIAQSSSSTQGQAAEALAGLVGAGVTGNLQGKAAALVETSKRLGIEVADLVKQYAELGKDPVKASLKLNEQQRYLTLAVYEHIKALEEQGRTAEAGEAAQKAYADAQRERNRQLEASLGDYQRAWEALGTAAKKAWDWMLNIGRAPEPQQALAAAEERLAFMQRKGPEGGFGQFAREEVDAQKALVAQLQARVDQTNGLAAAQGRYNRIQQDAIAAEQRLAKYAPKADERKKAIEEFERDIKAYQEGRRLNNQPELTAAEIAARRKVLLDKFKDRGGSGSRRDDAATRMLQSLRETEASLNAQLEGEQKLGAAAKARVEFEQQVADLKEKKTLTADQKSLLANADILIAQLRKNEALETEAQMRDLIKKKTEEQARAEEKFAERAAQIQQEIVSAREGRIEQYDRQIGAFGQGDMQREMIQAQNSLYREFQRRQAQLLKDTPEHMLGSDKYISESMKIKQALDQALADHQGYYARLREEQSKWENGMSRALHNYADDAANVSAQTERLFSGSFQGMEDALTRFVTTGKLSFQDLSDFVVAEVNRMIIRSQITGPLAQSMNSSGGGLVSTLMAAIFGGGGAGAAPASTGGGYFGGITLPNANGNVFGRSGVEKFSAGAVVEQPTLFSFAGGRRGEMGEAGYEAIMPVTRGADGKLGVKASGSAGSQTFVTNINLPNVRDYEGFRRSENQIKSRISGWSMGARRVS